MRHREHVSVTLDANFPAGNNICFPPAPTFPSSWEVSEYAVIRSCQSASRDLQILDDLQLSRLYMCEPLFRN